MIRVGRSNTGVRSTSLTISHSLAAACLLVLSAIASAQQCHVGTAPLLKVPSAASSAEAFMVTVAVPTVQFQGWWITVDGSMVNVVIFGTLKQPIGGPGSFCGPLYVGPLAPGNYQVNLVQALPPAEAPVTSVVATAPLVVTDAGRPTNYTTVVPEHPIAERPLSLRIRASTPSSPVMFTSPHTTTRNGNVIRMEGCYRAAGFAAPGAYVATAGVEPLPVGTYRVEYYKSECDAKDRPRASRFSFSFAFEVRDAADWPPPSDVMPVTQYAHSSFGHYFMTADESELVALDSHRFSGWEIMESTYVNRPGEFMRFGFWTAREGRIPVCRFLSTAFAPKSSHFYTASAEECETVKSNPHWLYEGQVGYVLPTASVTGCPSGVPLYRLYNNGAGGAPNHFFTIDPELVAGWVQYGGWTLEGLLGCVPRLPKLSSP